MYKVIAFILFIAAALMIVPVIIPILLVLGAISACLMGLYLLASAFEDDAKEARRRQHALNARRHEAPVAPVKPKAKPIFTDEELDAIIAEGEKEDSKDITKHKPTGYNWGD